MKREHEEFEAEVSVEPKRLGYKVFLGGPDGKLVVEISVLAHVVLATKEEKSVIKHWSDVPIEIEDFTEDMAKYSPLLQLFADSEFGGPDFEGEQARMLVKALAKCPAGYDIHKYIEKWWYRFM